MSLYSTVATLKQHYILSSEQRTTDPNKLKNIYMYISIWDLYLCQNNFKIRLPKKQSSHFHIMHRVQPPEGSILRTPSLLMWKTDCIFKESDFIYNTNVTATTLVMINNQAKKKKVHTIFISHIKGLTLN